MLYRVDFTTAKTRLVNNMTGNSVNAIGYNVFDNYLYGSNLFNQNTAYLVKIGGRGNYASIKQLPLHTPGVNWNAGEVDDAGHYWAAANGANWIKVDVHPESHTYGKIVESGQSDAGLYTPIDWAWVPGGGDALWALGYAPNFKSTQLMRFDRTLHTWTRSTNFGHVAGSNAWGAIYAGANQTIIASENISGQIWQFPLPTVGKYGKRLSTGPASNNNDGARCARAI